MKIKEDKVEDLIQDIENIILTAKADERKNKAVLKAVDSNYKKSARNLIHYLALRRYDIRKIQKQLGNLGMSRLARAESHIMASLRNTRFFLNKLISHKAGAITKSNLSIKSGNKLLAKHTKELLGYRSKGRRVRIMVTQPTDSAYDYQLVFQMVKNGMNCARINCAHDSPEVWEAMIKNIKQAAKALGKNVKIAMDLAGPKIRTGAINPGAKVKKFRPERNEVGQVISPATILLVPNLSEESEPNAIPVQLELMQQLEVGDKFNIVDTREKIRILKVISKGEEEVLLHCYDTSYIGTGTELVPEREGLETLVVGEMPPIERALLLKEGDFLTIHKENKPGEPATYDEDGNLLTEAHISCQLPEVFEAVSAGEVVLFDDGKIKGIVVAAESEAFRVRITRAKLLGSKLKAEKGINFPDTDLHVSGLTEKDRNDLKFVAAHADAVNFSFVNRKEDVEELFEELEKLDALGQLSIILKIETKKAFDNLPEILLTAMQTKYIGVMIARGDLAVETGWDNIGWVQKEILAMCNAAHIPSIWATQVLENLAKKGLPSRSEITDATYSLRSECVMLNKGAYINDAIGLLSKILSDLEKFQEKNIAMLPKLGKLSKSKSKP